MKIKSTIQKALSDGHTPDEIWAYLSQNHPTVKQALSDGHSPESIQKFLELNIGAAKPEISPVTPMTQPIQPEQPKPSVLDKVKDKIKAKAIEFMKPVPGQVDALYGDPSMPVPGMVSPQSAMAEASKPLEHILRPGPFQIAQQELLKRGYSPQQVQTVQPLTMPQTLEEARALAPPFELQPEARTINLALELGRIGYWPIKYGLERPLARGATEGRKETFKGWAEEAGWSPVAATAIDAAMKIFTLRTFWGAVGSVTGKDPIEYVFGDKDAEGVKNAIDSKDYKRLAWYAWRKPEAMEKVFDVDTIAKVSTVLKEQDPQGYQEYFDALRELTRGMEAGEPLPKFVPLPKAIKRALGSIKDWFTTSKYEEKAGPIPTEVKPPAEAMPQEPSQQVDKFLAKPETIIKPGEVPEISLKPPEPKVPPKPPVTPKEPIVPVPEIQPSPPTELEQIIQKPEPKIPPKIEEKPRVEAKPLVEPGKAKTELESLTIRAKELLTGYAYAGTKGILRSAIERKDLTTLKEFVPKAEAEDLKHRLVKPKEPTELETIVKTKPEEPKAKLEIIVQKEPSFELSSWVRDELRQGKEIKWRDLFKEADKSYGGTQAEGKYSPKDAYDAVELGVNRQIAEGDVLSHGALEGGLLKARNSIIALKNLISKIPTQTKRTEEMEEFQQFSTPPPLAYMANRVANIGSDDIYLEPSAGTGSLAIFGKKAGAKVIVNELSPRRLVYLKQLGFNEYHNIDASQLNNILHGKVSPSVIVMNPPFSATAGRIKFSYRLSRGNKEKGYRKTAEGVRHIEQALKLLQPGGRLVAITGEGMAMGRPAFRDWWSKIKDEYNVRANIGVSGKEYAKYGTTFDNQIIVIDKTGKTSKNIVTGKVDKVEDLIPLLEEIRNDRIRPSEQGTLESIVQKGIKEREAKPRSELTSLLTTGEMGTGEREVRGKGLGITREPGRPSIPVEPTKGHEIPGRRREPRYPERPEPEEIGKQKLSTKPSRGRIEPARQPTERDITRISKAEGLTSELQIEATKKAVKGELSDNLYEGYRPERLKIPGAKPHPTPLVQSAAMASVTPPAPTYKPSLPQNIISSGKISDVQLEATVYAGQIHQKILPNGMRMGFFIGDGTGVGKGREIASIIWDNWNKGRKKALWISEKKSLFEDAQRDIEDTGWDKSIVFDHGKIKATDTIKAKEGILFTTYDTLKSKPKKEGLKSRLDQIIEWLGKDFDGIIAFDESHNMGNAIAIKGKRGTTKPSFKALSGIEIQNKIPDSRKLYVSATGATEVMNLAYAEGLGLWGEGTAFADKKDFINKISSGGIAAMELVARDMKAMGVYIARSLSYDGVECIPLEHTLTPEQTAIYNKLAEGWQIVLQNILKAFEITGANSRAKGVAQSVFWGAHQRFFNQIITSMQTISVIDRIHKDLADTKEPKSIVIQLVNTLEAAQERTLSTLTEEEFLEDLDLTPRDTLMQLIEHSFPTTQFEEYTDEDGNIRTRPVYDSQGNPVKNAEAVEMQDKLLDELGSIRVPDSPIDMIINEFGIDNVAEITGRKRRVVVKEGKTVIEKRSNSKCIADADAFMAGKKRILIFSEKGGTGRSYHADLSKPNQQKRIHYLLQAGWRADKVLQGFGRTHRSNQKQPPKYIPVTTNIKGQKRFISSVARRLDQVGALTKGQRQTGGQGIFQARDNLESDYAKDALSNFYHDLATGEIKSISMAEFERQTGLKLTDKFGNLLQNLPPIRQFLNRLLSLNINTMNAVFDEFSKRMDNVIEAHVRAGTFDQGLETLKAQKIEKVSEEIVHTDEKTKAETKYVQLDVTNPAPIFRYSSVIGYAQQFFINKKSGKIWAGRLHTETDRETGDVVDIWILKSPSYSQQKIAKNELSEDKWQKLTKEEAKKLWDESVKKLPETIVERMHLITGTLLPIWDRLIGHPRIMRIQTIEGERMIGRIIAPTNLSRTLTNIGASAAKIEMNASEVHKRVIDQNYNIKLANNWEILRRKVSGEDRIELVGPDYSHFDILRKHGAFTERINWATRIFIPSSDEGIKTIEHIIKDKPIVSATPPITTREDIDIFGESTELYTAPGPIHKIFKFKHTFEPVDAFTDDKINEKNAQRYAAKKLYQKMINEFPGESEREKKFLYLVTGGVPRDATERMVMGRLAAWGERGVNAGALRGTIENYLPYGFKNSIREIRQAMAALDEASKEKIESVDWRLARWDGHLKCPRKSKDWQEFLGRIDKLNHALEKAGSGIVIEPETDLAKVLYNYENSVAQKILNQELIGWLEKYHDPITHKGMIITATRAWGDDDYIALSDKINVKVKWVDKEIEGKKYKVPLRYYVHKKLKLLKNYLEADPGAGEKWVQDTEALFGAIKRLKLFNPFYIYGKMAERIWQVQGVKPLLNIARLRSPWFQGKQALKNSRLVHEAIRYGVPFYEEFTELPRAPIEDEKFDKIISIIDKIPGRKINDRLVQGALQASRMQLYLYYRDYFSSLKDKSGKPQFNHHEARRMAGKMASDITYARLRHEMSRYTRFWGKLAFFSRNATLGRVDVLKRNFGIGPKIFTEKQVKAMSSKERIRLAKVLFILGAIGALINKKVTGRYLNTEKGYRGKIAFYKDKDGRVHYTTIFDYAQDYINVLGQWNKFLGKGHPVPMQIVQQLANKDIWSGKEITKREGLAGAKERALHLVREVTPGQDTTFWAESIPMLIASIKNKGWGKTFRDFETGQYLDFLLPWVGKWSSHGWEGMGIIGDIYDEVERERAKEKSELERLLKVGAETEAVKRLKEKGMTPKEILEKIVEKPGSPRLNLFKLLPLEYKIKTFEKLQANKSVWDNIPASEKKIMAEQLKRSYQRSH